MSDTPITDRMEFEGARLGEGMIVEADVAREIELECRAWKECAGKLYSSSGWHDQWPMAVQHYKQLKKKYE